MMTAIVLPSIVNNDNSFQRSEFATNTGLKTQHNEVGVLIDIERDVENHVEDETQANTAQRDITTKLYKNTRETMVQTIILDQ